MQMVFSSDFSRLYFVIPGLTCKACSLEVLSSKEGSEETEHNNNNVDIIRPKSHHNHGLCQEISPNIIPLNDIEDIYESKSRR